MDNIRPYFFEQLIRLGRDYDGGYLVPVIAMERSSTLISFGYGNDASFERHFINFRKGNEVYLFDDSSNFKSLFLKMVNDCFRRILCNDLTIYPLASRRHMRV